MKEVKINSFNVKDQLSYAPDEFDAVKYGSILAAKMLELEPHRTLHSLGVIHFGGKNPGTQEAPQRAGRRFMEVYADEVVPKVAPAAKAVFPNMTDGEIKDMVNDMALVSEMAANSGIGFKSLAEIPQDKIPDAIIGTATAVKEQLERPPAAA